MAKKRPLSDLVRHFPENGVKWLLHHHANVRDTLRLASRETPWFPDLDRFVFEEMTVQPGTFIRERFAHALSDHLVRMPFRLGDASELAAGKQAAGKRGGPKQVAGKQVAGKQVAGKRGGGGPGGRGAMALVDVYVLFEHLSNHDRMAVSETIDYVFDVYREQKRVWRRRHAHFHRFHFQMVAPVVFHAGERPWRRLTPMRELVLGGEYFPGMIPDLSPLLFSLPATPEAVLRTEGGALGESLRVLRARKAPADSFQEKLEEVTRALENRLLADDRVRLSELLRYLVALVYHFRQPGERDALRETVTETVRAPALQQELKAMGRTIVQSYLEQGRRKGKAEGKAEGELAARKETLLRQLRKKFGEQVTPALEERVQTTKEIATLDAWLDNFVTANTVAEVGVDAG